MSDCKEYVIGVMEIWAWPVKDADDDNASNVVNQLTPYIPANGMTLQNTDIDIVIGLTKPANTNATLVPIVRMTGKAKDDESDSVAGRLHTVTVSCEVDERGGEIWRQQLTLERKAHHLLLTYRDGVTKAFVAASADAYQCNVERDGSKVTVAFKIQNLMGIQQLLTSTT